MKRHESELAVDRLALLLILEYKVNLACRQASSALILQSFNDHKHFYDVLKNNLQTGSVQGCQVIINKCRAPSFDRCSTSVKPAVCSVQVTLRHTKWSAYCCFLPDLTGFTGFRCAEPKRQHHLPESDQAEQGPREGIQPRYSGLRVQGTATSPPSTTNLIMKLVRFFNARTSIAFLRLKCNR
ncbi:hypothetical protein BBEV_3358 [Salisediminibacterium beveridgei]|uniref:Uncharacterized protein n=1 Tax=Salisediminibacterium beveridgei TaxID=632773 RepID=A0A1D7R076_9BACI|nr:hypothetical protein BBEV_3358 [Salisediminibacterium beveridgei]